MPRLRLPGFAARSALSPLVLALALLLFPVPANALTASEGGGEVPAPYERLYKELAQGLIGFANRMAKAPAPAGPPARFFACLPLANGQRGRALLEPEGMAGNLAMLDALKDMGVQGVKVAIPYPLLVDGQSQAPEYRDFYSRLALEVRKRGLGLYVHMTPVFRNPMFARQAGDARFGALDRLALAARAQAETVLALLKPDILGLVNEPSTAADSANLPDLATPEGLPRFLEGVARDLAHNGTRIAAGLGSWEAPELAAALAASPLVELLDIHVYAVRTGRADCLAQADDYAQMARLLGKSVALGEVWLYKAAAPEMTPRRLGEPATSQEVFRRDFYGFWSPLDIAFLRLMARLAAVRGLEFVCPSWPQYFFSYLEFESRLEGTAYPALVRNANAVAFDAMRRGRLTATGAAFRQAIRK